VVRALQATNRSKRISGPRTPRTWRGAGPAKGPDRYQRVPALSTQRRARAHPGPSSTGIFHASALSPASTDPDAHAVCTCLAHLHDRLDPTFTRAPKPAPQANLPHRHSANPPGPYAPAQPGPKRGDLSCDPNWIHPRSRPPPVVPERGPRPPTHRKPSAIPNAYKFLVPTILSPATQPE
jgi:hypothetical protein